MIRAAGRGALAALAVAAIGQIPPLLIDLFGGGLAAATAVRIGWLYTLSFNHVAIEAVGTSRDAGATATVITLEAAVLGGTVVAIWLLYRGGAAMAARAGSGTLARLATALAVAFGYALPIFGVTLAMHLRLRTDGTILFGRLDIHGVAWQALVLPFSIGVVAAAAGALLAPPAAVSVRARAWLTGGWRAFGWALGFALVGLLVLAALRPQGTAHYARVVTAPGPKAVALVAGHHVALAPNEAMFLLTPALGGCVTAGGSAGEVEVLCLRTVPDLGQGNDVVDAWVLKLLDEGRDIPTTTAPTAMLSFLLVPVGALAVAGLRLGREAGSRREAFIRALGAAAVFALLVAVTAWASRITLEIVAPSSDGGVRASGLFLGPRLPEVAALAIVWGLVGLTLTAVLSARQKPEAPGPEGGDALAPTSA